MNYTTLLASLEEGIYTLTINRPDKLNALNRDVFTDLNNALDEIEKNPDIKSVIITGAGEKARIPERENFVQPPMSTRMSIPSRRIRSAASAKGRASMSRNTSKAASSRWLKGPESRGP